MFTSKRIIFKKDSPHPIEIKELSIPIGEELELLLNGKRLSKIKVDKDKEAEFDHWSDEDVKFPFINEGYELERGHRLLACGVETLVSTVKQEPVGSSNTNSRLTA